MSHQTGIQADDALKKSFCKCRDGKSRILKISIIDEQLKLSKQLPVKGTWENDFDTYVPALVENGQPCFILYRLDTSNSLGNEWLLISWSPDSSPVRQKMLYASTKATLKQEFGSAHIKDEFHATTMEEATLKGYKGHLNGLSAPAPLTEREEALKELKINEHGANYSPNGRQTTMGGVAFPTSDEAKQRIHDLKLGSYNYLQFKIDLEEEKIHIAKAAKITLSTLPKQVPSDEARYHLYIFSHTHEGDHMDSTVFIYSMPGYNCSIRERMLYSSCKGPFIEEIENSGLVISKKLEIDEGKDLTEEFLYDEIHPKRNLHRPAFAKPKGPPNRGARRMTKQQDAS